MKNEAKFTKGPWVFNDATKNCKLDHGFYNYKGDLVMDFGDDDPDQMYGSPPSKFDRYLLIVAPEMYEMINLLSNELEMAIKEINTMRDIHHSDNLTPADHWDQESLHDSQVLLAKARGEK